MGKRKRLVKRVMKMLMEIKMVNLWRIGIWVVKSVKKLMVVVMVVS